MGGYSIAYCPLDEIEKGLLSSSSAVGRNKEQIDPDFKAVHRVAN